MRSPLLIGFSSLLAVGCATAPAPRVNRQGFTHHSDLKPAVYFPLAPDNSWSYGVFDANSGETLLFLSRVESREGNRSILSTGNDPLAYEDRGDEIVRLPSGTVVLRAPLKLGNEWRVTGGRARITSVHSTVEAEDGQRFDNCLVVEETTPDRHVVTSFAPHVGPVRVEIYLRTGDRERLAERGLLRSFHKGSAKVSE